jgi:hypothetical protein
MSRQIRALLVLCAVSFVLVASACADATAPQTHEVTCDVNNPNICH